MLWAAKGSVCSLEQRIGSGVLLLAGHMRGGRGGGGRGKTSLNEFSSCGVGGGGTRGCSMLKKRHRVKAVNQTQREIWLVFYVSLTNG